MSFEAKADRTYSVMRSVELMIPDWQKWQDVPSHPTNRIVFLLDPADVPIRFCCLVTPAAP